MKVIIKRSYHNNNKFCCWHIITTVYVMLTEVEDTDWEISFCVECSLHLTVRLTAVLLQF